MRLRIALTAGPDIAVPPTRYGGVERIVDMLARGLAERGHDVTLFARSGSSCPVPKIAWGGGNRAMPATVLNAALLARRVSMDGYDIVHNFSRLAYLAPILAWPTPKLVSCHNPINPRTTGLANRLARGTMEFSAISRRMLEHAPLPGRWHLVPNGIDLSLYDPQTDVAADAPLIFLGRIEEVKGAHLAVAAAQKAGRRLILAGNVAPENQAWFAEHIAPHIDGNRVSFAGAVDDAAKNALLGSAAALLMPVLWEEPFGLVMIEAMACGTPVIGLRRGAVPEVVADGETGYVVDTVEEMAEGVAWLQSISRAACRARVERLYSDASLTERHLTVYTDVIARVRGASPGP
jgi:glycosyltransferase involved in cell wall biosynthesis